MPSPDGVNIRNGYRHLDFDTRTGTLDLSIPGSARGATSRTGCWNGAAAEAALTSVVATCYLLGGAGWIVAHQSPDQAESVGRWRPQPFNKAPDELRVMHRHLVLATDCWLRRMVNATSQAVYARAALGVKVVSAAPSSPPSHAWVQ
jgi:hypothetical protein